MYTKVFTGNNAKEALAKVKTAAPRPTKPGPARKEELPEPPRPYYGPGYPAWPGY